MQRTRFYSGLIALALGGLGSLVAIAPAQGRAWAGFTMSATTGGVRVDRVLPSSPATQAGLRSGDVIQQVDGRGVTTPQDIVGITSRTRPGKTLRLQLRRGGRALTRWLRLAKTPDAAALLRLYWLNQPAPGFTAPLINRAGKKSLASLRGKMVILYFWASWCDSCKLNMPKLKRLHREFASKGLVIYSFSQDKKASKTRQTLKLLSLPFLVGHNYRNRVGKRFLSNKIPTLIAVDRKGIIRDLVRGSTFGYGRLKRIVQRLR
jgi:thiol-disulfide isomerase/thioredoxin